MKIILFRSLAIIFFLFDNSYTDKKELKFSITTVIFLSDSGFLFSYPRDLGHIYLILFCYSKMAVFN